MTESDVNFILRALERVQAVIDTNTKQISTLTTEISSIKADVTCMKANIAVMQDLLKRIDREVFGNGKEGLATRTTTIENKVKTLESASDRAITADEVIQGKFRAMETKILQWSGLILGVNLTIGAILTWIVNWEKIILFFRHIGGK